MTLYSQTNLDSLCSILTAASVFDGIVKNASCQRTFDVLFSIPLPEMIIKGAIGCPSRSSLVRMDRTVNSGRNISVLLRFAALPFI